jgi:RNA polymerase sigma factor (sigma-70 family)
LCNALLHEDRRAIDTIGTFIRPIIEAEIVNREDREDVQQHCMLEIVEFLRKTDEIQNIWALARRISINTVIDFKRHSRSSAILIFPTDDGSNPEAESPGGKPGASVLREIALRDQLHYILKSINKRCRQIFKTLFVEEASYAEASARMGITEGNLRVRLNRCREQALSIRKKVFGY